MGESWGSELAKRRTIKRRRLRSIFENDMIRATLEAGIPAAIFEPDIEGVKGVPDLLLPNKILIEFAGYTQKGNYIQKLVEKVNALGNDYKIILVAYNNRVLSDLMCTFHGTCVISKKEYLKWIRMYARWLKMTLQKELLSIPLPAHLPAGEEGGI